LADYSQSSSEDREIGTITLLHYLVIRQSGAPSRAMERPLNPFRYYRVTTV
jgi:hypothetical protein